MLGNCPQMLPQSGTEQGPCSLANGGCFSYRMERGKVFINLAGKHPRNCGYLTKAVRALHVEQNSHVLQDAVPSQNFM